MIHVPGAEDKTGKVLRWLKDTAVFQDCILVLDCTPGNGSTYRSDRCVCFSVGCTPGNGFTYRSDRLVQIGDRYGTIRYDTQTLLWSRSWGSTQPHRYIPCRETTCCILLSIYTPVYVTSTSFNFLLLYMCIFVYSVVCNAMHTLYRKVDLDIHTAVYITYTAVHIIRTKYYVSQYNIIYTSKNVCNTVVVSIRNTCSSHRYQQLFGQG